MTPYYNKPPARGIVAHFKAIADATDRPILVYNIPQRVVVNLEPETIAELAEIPNVTAVKQAHDRPGPGAPDPRRDRPRRSTPATTTSCSRSSSSAAWAACSSTPTSSARRSSELVRASRKARPPTARAIEAELRPVIDALAVTTNPIPVKAALQLLGHEVGGLRLPLLEATDEERTAIRDALERAGVLENARV